MMCDLNKEFNNIFTEAIEKSLPEYTNDITITKFNMNKKTAIILPKHITETEYIKINKIIPSVASNDQSSRKPFSLQILGEFKEKKFKVVLCCKLGNLDSKNKNDLTTYGNVLKFYLDIDTQRISAKTKIDYNTILYRKKGNEIVSIFVFVLDHDRVRFRLYSLEEIEESEIIINPRRHMVQISYNPKLRTKVMTYQELIRVLLDKLMIALSRIVETTKDEIKQIEKLFDYF